MHPTSSFPACLHQAVCKHPARHLRHAATRRISSPILHGLRDHITTTMSASAKSLSTLLAQASLDDHDEVLKAANAAVKKSKSDVDAHYVKAVALLHLDRYEDALEVFENTSGLQEKAVFEYAYALYKTGNASKAAEVAEAAQVDSGRGMKHMLAQAVRGKR
jgi:tetratricopeptide (TPR) repeat protein